MTYREAMKLHNGDEVRVIETNEVMQVIEIIIYKEYVDIMLEDGNYYYHKEIK